MKIEHLDERLEASDSKLVGSSFKRVNLADTVMNDVNLQNLSVDDVNLAGSSWNNVNLSGLQITQANLSHASISESCTHGMTIDGILVEDLIAAHKATRPNR